MGSRGPAAALAALFTASAVAGIGRAEAQSRYPGTPGYPSVGRFGGVGSGFGPYAGVGGFGAFGGYAASPYAYVGGTGVGYGTFGYPGLGYNSTNGLVGPGYLATNSLVAPTTIEPVQQTTVSLEPLYNAITSIPGWYGSPAPRPRPRPTPRVPRDQLLSDDGTVLWPSATPDDAAVAGTRKVAEDAIRGVVSASHAYGQATVRQVVDAKNKLTAFTRRALPIVMARNAADSNGLETFIVELGKTLQTMAVNY